MYHQSQQTIPTDLPEGFIESPMWVGTGIRLQVRRLPTGNDRQALIQTQYDGICDNIRAWQIKIYEDPITFEGINAQFVRLKGSIHSFYQEALYSRVTDKLSYDIISLIGQISCVKRAADTYIRMENRIASTSLNNSVPRDTPVTNDIIEVVSELGKVISDQLSPIVASGCSGSGNLTATLQVQGGGGQMC